jgi:hypothetical protein
MNWELLIDAAARAAHDRQCELTGRRVAWEHLKEQDRYEIVQIVRAAVHRIFQVAVSWTPL